MPRVKVSCSQVREFLEERQRSAGGYPGEDLTRISRMHSLHPDTFSKRVGRLITNDPDFRGFHYLGKRAPHYDLDDYTSLCEMLQDAPLTPPITIARNLNLARQARGLPPIPESTAYAIVQTYVIGLPSDRKDPMAWFTHAYPANLMGGQESRRSFWPDSQRLTSTNPEGWMLATSRWLSTF